VLFTGRAWRGARFGQLCAVRLGAFTRQIEGLIERHGAFVGVALDLAELFGVRGAQRLPFGVGLGAHLIELVSQRD
jgi:hypothetical protein